MSQRRKDKRQNSPDGVNYFRATDRTVRGNQGKPFNQRSGSDNAICLVFGISGREPHGAGTRAAGYREDNKASLDLLQEGFEADTEVDAAPIRESPDLPEGHIRDRQTVSAVAGFVNGGSCFSRNLALVKGEPDDHVRVDKNQ